MKRILSAILVCVLLVGCVVGMASCGKKLSGKYSDAAGVTTYEFSGSKVTLTVSILGTKTYEGEYSIEENDEGKQVITFTFGEEADDKYSGNFVLVEGEEDGKKYIKLGEGILALTYYKQ